MRVTPPYEDHSVLPRPPGGSESPTTALYKAALGPVNTADYLPVFERFDAAGRPGLVWNPAAGLLTLNWMAFRGLWSVALVYLAAAQGLALMVLGLSRHVLDWPLGVELGVLGTLLLLSVALPGLYGNALLHADIRRRMATAVTNAHTLREACEALELQAPSRKRLQTFMAVNALLVFLALALGSFALFRPPAAPVVVSVREATEASQPPPQSAEPPATAPASTLPSPSVAEPAEPMPLPAPPSAAPPVVAPPVALPDAIPGAAPGTVVRSPEAAPSPATTTAATTAPASAVEPRAQPAPAAAAPAPRAQPRSAEPPAAETPSAAASAAASAVPHSINVGLFAEEANAAKVHAQLIDAGLPATLQTVDGPRGPRTRVRAGPFPDRPSAEAAAQRIRSLGLEAQVFRQ